MLFRFFIVFYLWCIVRGQDAPENDAERMAKGEKKLSDNILRVMEHFQQEDPVGVPGANISEPHRVPDMKQSLTMGTTVVFKNTAIYGISKFRIKNVNVEVGPMEVHAVMTIDMLQARGNYTMSTWLNKAQGPFTINVTGLIITAHANLGVARDGKLLAQDINIDIIPTNFNVDFQNLGFLGSVFQGVVNSVGIYVFDTAKPYILKDAHAKMRAEINSKLEETTGDMQFPNSITPLDMVIADARDTVRGLNYDPFKVKDYNNTMGVFSIILSHTWVTGLSSFHRIGNITLKITNNTLVADFEIGFQKLEGITQWEIVLVSGVMSRAGRASFSVEYMNARVVLVQPLDTRKNLMLQNVELEVGNIQVRCDGAGSLDYIIEFVVNVLPNLIRYQIMDAIKAPLKNILQEELDKINVEDMIKQELPQLDELEKKGLKLSALINNEARREAYDEDEFFNF